MCCMMVWVMPSIARARSSPSMLRPVGMVANQVVGFINTKRSERQAQEEIFMKFETLEFKREGAVGILTMNRPQAMNALNAQVLEDLGGFLQQVVKEKGLRA